MTGNLEKIVNSLLECWGLKLVAATFFGLVIHQALLFAAFAVLVWLDCITKWIAISYSFNHAHGLAEAIRGIPAAHQAKAISSTEMRRGIYDKMLGYFILVIGALFADWQATTPIFVNLIISYLSATEFLSIVENLNDAGLSALGGLIAPIKGRAHIPDSKPPTGSNDKGGHNDNG